MKRFSLSFFFAFCLLPSDLFPQVPVTVNRSTIDSGGAVILPSFNGSFSFNPQVQTPTMNFTGGGASGPIGDNWASSSGTVTASPGTIPGNSSSTITLAASPTVTIATNAPSIFTNSISAFAVYSGGGIDRNTPSVSQSYVVTIVENVNAGGSSNSPDTATLSGFGGQLQSVSRKDTSIDPRELLGFQLKATTNANMNSLAVSISNTSTNTNVANANIMSITLFQDVDGAQTYDSSDTVLATTSNANGFAIFSGLSIPLTSTGQTFFVTASFDPTRQTQNSFITAYLRSSNVVVTKAGTNAVIETTGGTITGKQYAFLDTTTEEDAATAAALTARINAAVLNVTNGLSNSSTTTKGLIDSILPAAAAGAAGIGAAFTSDSISKTPLSRDYLTPR